MTTVFNDKKSHALKRALLLLVLLVLLCPTCSGFSETQGKMLLQVGSMISIGQIEQDGNLENGKEEILWQILSADDDVILISRYGLDVRPYDTQGWRGEEYHFPKNDFEKSDLYHWLNGEFLSDSFSDEERGMIIGDVSLLTCDEATTYFHSAFERKIELTPYAEQTSTYKKQRYYWWLRHTYETYQDVWPYAAQYNSSSLPSYISDAGLPCVYYVLKDYTYMPPWELNDQMAVRPVIRVNKEELQRKGYVLSDTESVTVSGNDFYAGSHVIFGQIFNTDGYLNVKDTRYLHDGMDWTVLRVWNGKALLISTYAVGDIGAKSLLDGGSSWEWKYCTLNDRLNRWRGHQIGNYTVHADEEPLFNFSKEEKEAIIGDARLMTVQEVETYFPDRESRVVVEWQSGKYALDWWVLQNNYDADELYQICYVDIGDPEGSVTTRGTGEVQTVVPHTKDFEANRGNKAVRPVIEVDLSVLFPEFSFQDEENQVQSHDETTQEESELPMQEGPTQIETENETSVVDQELIGKWRMDSATNGTLEEGVEHFLVFDAGTLHIVDSVAGTMEDHSTGYTIEGDIINVVNGARLKYSIIGNSMTMESDQTDADGNPVRFTLSRVDRDDGDNIPAEETIEANPLMNPDVIPEQEQSEITDKLETTIPAEETIETNPINDLTTEPTSVPTDGLIKSISFGYTLPEGHALNRGYEGFRAGFSLVLNQDGTLKSIEEMAEGNEVYFGTWKREGDIIHLSLPKLSGLESTIRISGGKWSGSFYNTKAEGMLPENSVAFFEQIAELQNVAVAPDPEGVSSEEYSQTPDEEYTEEIELASAQEHGQDQESISDAALPVNPLIDGKRQVQVSSVQADTYITGSKESYPPQNMIDGDETTAWQFSTKNSKLKETYVYFTFTEPQTIDELWIKNGFWRITAGKDQYTRNSRVRQMGIAFMYAGSSDYTDKQTVNLKDDKKRSDWQKIDLSHHQEVIGIRFRIISIYKGSKFKNDVCISEVMFVAK